MKLPIPKHWENTTLGEVCLKSQYGWTSKASGKGNLRYLRTTDISGKNVNWDTVPFCKKEPDFKEDYLLNDGDILISRSGSVGISHLVEDIPYECVFASYLIRFQPFYVHSKFIYYFLQSESYWKAINKEKSGVAMTNVNATQLSAIKIPLPPLNEQREIADTLDDILYQLDYYEKRLNAIPVLLKEYREMVLEEAVSGKLTEEWREKNSQTESAATLLKKISKRREQWILEATKNENKEGSRLKKKLKKHSFEIPSKLIIPKKWKWTSLLLSSNLIVDCHNKTAPYEKNGIFLVRTSNVKNGKLRFENMKYVSNLTYKHWSRRCPPMPKDIVFTREAPMGDAAVIPENTKICLGQRTMLIRFFHDLIEEEYISIAIRAKSFQERMRNEAIGMGVKHLRVGDVESLTVPLPPLIEQKEIVKQVQDLLKKADKIEEYLQNTAAYLEQVRKIVFEKAFSGELVSPVEEEMSVKELLKKIKEEKLIIEQKRKAARKNRSSQPKPPKMTKETLKEFIQKEFSDSTFDFESLQQMLQNKVRYEYDELRNTLFELLRKPLKEDDDEAFLQTIFEDGIKFNIKTTSNETENS